MKLVAWWLLMVPLMLTPRTASAWSPFVSKNADVEKGNEALAAGKPEKALEAYDRAVGDLPNSPALQLNRGLAMLEAENFDQAKEAFLKATETPADKALRAKAYYNMGLAFGRQAEAVSGQEQYDQASQLYREAADSFKRSLRMQPGNRDAAWNLEVALRRIMEEQEKEQGQEQQQEQGQEQQQEQQQEQGQEQQQEQGQEQEQQQQGQEQEQREQALPQHVERFLDALEQNEESLPVHKARQRGRARRRAPEKDW